MPVNFASKLGLCLGLLAWPASVSAQETVNPSNPPPNHPAAVPSNALGTLQGVVTFHGRIPKGPPDDASVAHNLLPVDRQTRGLQYVTVHLAAKSGTPPPFARHPAAAERSPVMDQIHHQFVPRVMAIRTGKPVKFANSDAANHNVRASSSNPSNEFNVFVAAETAYEHRFAAPTDRPIRLDCDLHPWMRGWIYVFDHPWFCVTDERGGFRIESIPPGEYTLTVRQPDLRYDHKRGVTVSGGGTETVRIRIELEDASRSGE